MKKPQQGTLIGFVTATLSFAVIYMASAAPVPLFAIYRQTLDLTHSNLSYAAVAYFAGAVTALLMFARISDHFGRRIVIFINLLLAMFGCLIFLDLASSAMLLAGRFIQGFACGLASSAVAAYVVDNAPLSPAWFGSVVTGAAPMLGLAGGSLASGALRQYGSGSLSIIFVVIIVVCLLIYILGNEILSFITNHVPFVTNIIEALLNIRVLLSVGLFTVFFTFLYVAIPSRHTKIRRQLPGAIFSAVGWTGFSYFFSLYVNYSHNIAVLYGSLAMVVCAMLWLYVCMFIFLLGAEINLYIEQWTMGRSVDKATDITHSRKRS